MTHFQGIDRNSQVSGMIKDKDLSKVIAGQGFYYFHKWLVSLKTFRDRTKYGQLVLSGQ